METDRRRKGKVVPDNKLLATEDSTTLTANNSSSTSSLPRGDQQEYDYQGGPVPQISYSKSTVRSQDITGTLHQQVGKASVSTCLGPSATINPHHHHHQHQWKQYLYSSSTTGQEYQQTNSPPDNNNSISSRSRRSITTATNTNNNSSSTTWSKNQNSNSMIEMSSMMRLESLDNDDDAWSATTSENVLANELAENVVEEFEAWKVGDGASNNNRTRAAANGDDEEETGGGRGEGDDGGRDEGRGEGVDWMGLPHPSMIQYRGISDASFPPLPSFTPPPLMMMQYNTLPFPPSQQQDDGQEGPFHQHHHQPASSTTLPLPPPIEQRQQSLTLPDLSEHTSSINNNGEPVPAPATPYSSNAPWLVINKDNNSGTSNGVDGTTREGDNDDNEILDVTLNDATTSTSTRSGKKRASPTLDGQKPSMTSSSTVTSKSLSSKASKKPKTSSTSNTSNQQGTSVVVGGGGGGSGSIPVSKRKKKPPGMPKRPLSAYNLYFRAERANILAKQNEVGYKGERIGFEGLGKIIGKQWRDLSPDDKKEFDRLAEQDSERYRKEMEEYRERKQKMYREEDEAFEASQAVAAASAAAVAAAKAASLSSTTSTSLDPGHHPSQPMMVYHGFMGGTNGSGSQPPPPQGPVPPFLSEQVMKGATEPKAANVAADGKSSPAVSSSKPTDNGSAVKPTLTSRKSSTVTFGVAASENLPGSVGGVPASVAAAAGFNEVHVPGGGPFPPVGGGGTATNPRFVSTSGPEMAPPGLVLSQHQQPSQLQRLPSTHQPPGGPFAPPLYHPIAHPVPSQQFHHHHHHYTIPGATPSSVSGSGQAFNPPPQGYQTPQHAPGYMYPPSMATPDQQVPLPPGMEIILSDRNGVDRKYKVQYACYSMTREGADKYIESVMQYAAQHRRVTGQPPAPIATLTGPNGPAAAARGRSNSSSTMTTATPAGTNRSVSDVGTTTTTTTTTGGLQSTSSVPRSSPSSPPPPPGRSPSAP